MLLVLAVVPTMAPSTKSAATSAVAHAVKIARESGSFCETTSMFTIIEGKWDEVMSVVEVTIDAIVEVSPRVSLIMKADIHAGCSDEMRGKLERLENAIVEFG